MSRWQIKHTFQYIHAPPLMNAPSLLFTVFTPSYNRANTLHRVYESLMAQTFEDFEWLIVDDGSNDGTENLVRSWQNSKETWFPIRYIWQENQHKKAAHNRGVKEAKGKLFLTLDSDDRCLPEALERFAHHWEAIPENQKHEFSAVTALCKDENGTIIGDPFPAEWIDSDSLEIRYKFKISGEKWGFHRTEVLKQFLFPENIKGLVPEGVVWNQVARKYKTRFVNEALRIYCQNEDGNAEQLSSLIDPKLNAPGHAYWKWSILSYEISYFNFKPVMFFLEAARLTRFSLHCQADERPNYWPCSFFGKLLTIGMAPMGVCWWLADKLRH